MDLPDGYNWFLILIVCIVSVVILVANVYVLIYFQHPEDENQAWLPKIVVVMGLTVAVMSVLMFPLDVANRQSCKSSLAESACVFTLPMRELWFAIYITDLVLVWVVVPFTLFYYEADSDFGWFQRVRVGFVWTILVFVVVGIGMGVAYALAGFVEYPVQALDSGIFPINQLPGNITGRCIPPGSLFLDTKSIATLSNITKCDAALYSKVSRWKLRTSFPVYIMAVQSIIGWILFMVFAGWGCLAAPIDWLHQFVGRPRAIITRSQYMESARSIAQRAKGIKELAMTLRKQNHESGKNRKWRSQFKQLQREVIQLEEDEYQLDAVFPQGQDGDVKFVLFQLGYYCTGALGFIGIGVSLVWITHIIVYMLPVVPVSPLLNAVFIRLDKVFPLFGVSAFALFCLYLIVVAIKGNFMLGLNFLIINLYPMRPGGTMMSSFLVNTAVVLTMSPAVIQFCAQAFAVYANGTAITDIFGNQVSYLHGIQWIYNFNIFLYIFLGFMALGTMFALIRGPGKWKRSKKEDAYMY